jgi:CRP-like cAMP-binding protein
LAEGQTFGEAQMLGLFDRWSCSFTVSSSCMLCELTEAHLKEELKNYPEEAEYFNSIVDYYSIRNEEWTAREVRLSLRHSACLRQASDELLVELEKVMERRLLFAGDCLFTEGECSPSLGLAILYDGEVATEVAGRVVWAREVPHVEIVNVISSEAEFDRPAAQGRRASQGEGGAGPQGSTLMASREPSEEADAMLEKSLNLGPCRGASDLDFPEAAVFGEEVFMGTSRASTITVRARKMCDVRILHRQSLDRVIAKYPEDAKMLAEQFWRHTDAAFPPLQAQDARLFGANCEVSEDFVDFLKAHVEERVFFPGDYIKFDSLDENLPKKAIMPFLNHTFGRLNVGHVRAILPQTEDPLEGLRQNQILGPGSTIKGSWCWAGALF